MPLFHTPWLSCDDCFLNAEVDAELAIEFEAGGVPKLFHAEVGANFNGKVFVRANLPAPAPANDMGNWHNLIPRVWLGSFRFTVGYVPVDVSIAAELNGAAWSNEAFVFPNGFRSCFARITPGNPKL